VAWLHTVIDVPADLHASSARFWSEALGWPLGEPWPGHPELRSFAPPLGDAYVHLQQVDGPPRVHLDVESEDPDGTIATAVAAGARVGTRFERWVSMLSPGGLPFCVLLSTRARLAPEPVAWSDGHRSRLVQVCIDSPTTRHEEEVAFWQALLPGRWVGSRSPEFGGKWHDDVGSPLQLLFQRLGETEGDVRAHLDLGTDQKGAEVRRLRSLGADDVDPGHGGWHVLRDAVGLAFCVTTNAPDQTTRRDLA
jgi:Glyoxalase-like domain